MKRCKWCGADLYPSRVLNPWVHDSGFFTCPLRPEKLAEPADGRWEQVWAEVAEESRFGTDVLRFRIEIRYDGVPYYSNILVPKDDLKYAKFDLFAYTLDEMIYKIDELLEREV